MSDMIYYAALALVAISSAAILIRQYLACTMLTPAERRIRRLRGLSNGRRPR